VPVKGYTFDITTDTPLNHHHLHFRDLDFVAVNYKPNTCRIAAFGDLSG
jgi:hypothetical protein